MQFDILIVRITESLLTVKAHRIVSNRQAINISEDLIEHSLGILFCKRNRNFGNNEMFLIYVIFLSDLSHLSQK